MTTSNSINQVINSYFDVISMVNILNKISKASVEENVAKVCSIADIHLNQEIISNYIYGFNTYEETEKLIREDNEHQMHLGLKARYEDAVILFRCGDFYETYYEDAKTVSEVLGITLTKRLESSDRYMAGFPYHSLDTYLPKLIRAGLKVAIAEQIV